MTNETREESREVRTVEILKILAWQQAITNQGDKYNGEKDWALKKIHGLIDQACKEAVQAKVKEVRAEIETKRLKDINGCDPEDFKESADTTSDYEEIGQFDSHNSCLDEILSLPSLQLEDNKE